ncbi:MAG: arsenate reductase ArsC [Pseudomonadota bacterium]
MFTRNILILCTGNSARSILGEVIASSMPGLKGYSAGSKPKRQPVPVGLKVLKSHGHDVSGVSSKSWDVYAQDDAPSMDIIITVCDSAANESCPYWPGHPVQVHWGLPDPAYIEDEDEQRAAFEAVYARLHKQLKALSALDLDDLSPAQQRAAIQALHID